MLKSTIQTSPSLRSAPLARSMPRPWTSPSTRLELLHRADGLEGIARVPLGSGGPLDWATGARLSALREALDGRLVVVLERRAAQGAPERAPLLTMGDVLYLIGPPEQLYHALEASPRSQAAK